MRRFSIPILTVLLAGLVVTVLWHGRQGTAQSGGAGDIGAAIAGSVVYDGVAVVTTGGSTDGLLELGHVSTDAGNGLTAGLDIASTGTINLRPSSLTAANSVNVVRNGGTGRTDLVLPGGICFGTGAGQVCNTTWPAGGSSSYWTNVGGLYLQPTTLTSALVINRANPTNSSTALEAVSDIAGDAALSVDTTGTIAAHFEGGAYTNGNVYVTASGIDQVQTIYGGTMRNLWHPGNDGHNSGLDASQLDGVGLEFTYSAPSFRWCTLVGNYCLTLQ